MYAFAFVVAAVIAGLAVGSAVAGRLSDRLRRPALSLPAVQSGVVVSARFIVPMIGWLPLHFPAGYWISTYDRPCVTERPNPASREEPAAPILTGRWTYNKELSDDAHAKMREAMGRQGPGGGRPMGPGGGGQKPGGGGPMGPEGGGPPGAGASDAARESMRAILEPAEELVITQSDAELTVDEKYGRIRRLHPDGKKYKADNGTAETRSYRKAGRLVVETKRPRGSGIETWERVPDGSRLIVNVRLEGGLGPKVELKRIYDRVSDSGG